MLFSETRDDNQAACKGDGFEMVVGVLGIQEQEHPKHYAGFSNGSINSAPLIARIIDVRISVLQDRLVTDVRDAKRQP
jgi:hypothetical protein